MRKSGFYFIFLVFKVKKALRQVLCQQMFSMQIFRGESPDLHNLWQFLWCKYSHDSQLQLPIWCHWRMRWEARCTVSSPEPAPPPSPAKLNPSETLLMMYLGKKCINDRELHINDISSGHGNHQAKYWKRNWSDFQLKTWELIKEPQLS